jgi:hypothetical protein
LIVNRETAAQRVTRLANGAVIPPETQGPCRQCTDEFAENAGFRRPLFRIVLSRKYGIGPCDEARELVFIRHRWIDSLTHALTKKSSKQKETARCKAPDLDPHSSLQFQLKKLLLLQVGLATCRRKVHPARQAGGHRKADASDSLAGI